MGNAEPEMPKVAEMNPNGPAAQWFANLPEKMVRDMVYGSFEEHHSNPNLYEFTNDTIRTVREKLVGVSIELISTIDNPNFDQNNIDEFTVRRIQSLMKEVLSFASEAKMAQHETPEDYLRVLLSRLAGLGLKSFKERVLSITDENDEKEAVGE